MSRIGKIPVPVPAGVKVNLDGEIISVEGAKGRLEHTIPSPIEARIDGGEVHLIPRNDERETRGLFGLTRTLIANMVQGVTEGFQKELEINGVGYRAEVDGNLLTLSLGYSNPVKYEIPDGVSILLEKPTQVMVKGIDKQLVGQVAANIRSYRVVEPYKGKGIRYSGEKVRRKAGKSGKSGAK